MVNGWQYLPVESVGELVFSVHLSVGLLILMSEDDGMK